MHHSSNALPGNLIRTPACGQHVHICDAPVGLARIRDRAVNLVVWRRTLATCFPARDAELSSRYGVDVVIDTEGGGLPRCPALEASIRRECAPFDDDVLTLADWFARLVGRSAVRVRLDSLAGDAPPVFRVESEPLRLLVTYAGEGSEWVENSGVCRAQLDRPRRSFDEANRAIVRPGAAVYRSRPGWVLLQKGDDYPGNAGHGIVHRPSPGSGASGPGLLLTLCGQR